MKGISFHFGGWGRLSLGEETYGDSTRGEFQYGYVDYRPPKANSVARLGRMYVLDRGSRTVLVYDADGQRLDSLGPQLGGGIELRSPVDLAVDGSGRLFIADEKLPFVAVLE